MEKKYLVDKPKNFTLILYKKASRKSEVVDRLETKSARRFLTRLRLLPARFNGYLRVSYTGGGWNDGFYTEIDDLWLAFNAFNEGSTYEEEN